MKITNRLAVVASKVPEGSIVADIGTDHAYIPVFLVKNKISKRAIAADVNKGPLERAQEHIKQNGLAEQIETRLGSGLQVLRPGEVDTIVIAGMGGLLMRDLLDEAEDVLKTTKTLILQPMIAQDVLREWLNNNGFKIVDEELAREENKIYTIITAEHGEEKIEDEIYFDIGKSLFDRKDPLLKDYLMKKINEMQKILASLEGQETENVIERKKECENKLHKYNELLAKIDW